MIPNDSLLKYSTRNLHNSQPALHLLIHYDILLSTCTNTPTYILHHLGCLTCKNHIWKIGYNKSLLQCNVQCQPQVFVFLKKWSICLHPWERKPLKWESDLNLFAETILSSTILCSKYRCIRVQKVIQSHVAISMTYR